MTDDKNPNPPGRKRLTEGVTYSFTLAPKQHRVLHGVKIRNQSKNVSKRVALIIADLLDTNQTEL